ncbi:hypothetical protein BV22DRAFT_1099823, partial [Leucogyrophana mollusca]
MDDAAATAALRNLWVISNNQDKARWAQQLRDEARAAEAEQLHLAEEEHRRQQALADEEEEEEREERKKNKGMYVPLRNMAKGEYCEMWYFTNTGVREAASAILDSEPEALTLLPSVNGGQTWVPAGAIRDPKSQVKKDEHLTWEEFLEAAPRMIDSMKDNRWKKERVDMFIGFWSAIQNHRWRHSFDPLQQRALLVYQSQQRR